MPSAKQSDVLQFRSWGFELYVPPTPFSYLPKPTRFVMLDDLNDLFYDIDYETPLLGNATPWTTLALHTVRDPAIVFPPEQQDMLQLTNFATGFLVSIESRSSSLIIARKLGRVNVKPLPQQLMNWDALADLKGRELPTEMRAGLLRRAWNRRPGASPQAMFSVAPARVQDDMPRPWHRDGTALNYELDQRFVGAKPIGPPHVGKCTDLMQSRWRDLLRELPRLSNDQKQC